MATLILGERGQVTIPKKYREKLGIKPKSPVMLELKDDGILIRPVVTVPVREFSDEYIKRILDKDVIKTGERKEILSKWKKS
jgi:AbrB family looped-hinge helix DNA binding protein